MARLTRHAVVSLKIGTGDGGVEGFGTGVGGAGHAFEDVFGEEGDLGEGDACGVLDGVEDGGGGAVHGEFADAFGAEGSVRGWGSLRRRRGWGGGRRWWA